jgi:hypothetical protein
MGMANTQHFLIAMMQRHLHDLVDKYMLVDELFNEQSGHSDDVAMEYALEIFWRTNYITFII